MLLQSELVAIFDQLLGQKAYVRKGGIQATYHCPFCVDKNLVTNKLEIAVGGARIGSSHCWRCDFKAGSFGSLLYKLQAPPNYRESILKLTGDIRIARYAKPDLSFVHLPPEFHPMHKPKKTPEYKNALVYLKRRGITREDILRYNIGYCESGEYENHIIIPSYAFSASKPSTVPPMYPAPPVTSTFMKKLVLPKHFGIGESLICRVSLGRSITDLLQVATKTAISCHFFLLGREWLFRAPCREARER